MPKGLERLRITVTPKHRKEHIEKMVKSLDKVWAKNKLPRINIIGYLVCLCLTRCKTIINYSSCNY